MTTKSRAATKQVEYINSDLQSASSTTPQTLKLLRAVLGLDTQDGDKFQPAKATAKQLIKQVKPHAKITGAPRRPITKKPVQVSVREDEPSVVSPLDTKSRRSFATEVFNTTLKTLSNAARHRQENSRLSPKDKSTSTEPSVTRPLAECSPNRQAKPNQKKVQTVNEPQLDATVDCGATALQYLRQLETEVKGDHAVDLRLEQGALMLMDKLITLELVDQAVNHLRILHEQYWKRRKATSTHAEHEAEAERTAALAPLVFEVAGDKSDFRFGTSLQSSWLRLAILVGSTWVTKHAVAAMRPETNGSPSWAIIEGLRLDHLDKEACGMQLRTVSLALAKLYTTSIEKKTSPAPDPACLFELGCVALRIKAHSWRYLGHQPNLQKECWTPLRQYMQQYSGGTRLTSAKELPQDHVETLSRDLSELGFDGDLPAEVSRLWDDYTGQKASSSARLGKRMGDLTVNQTTPDLLTDLDAAARCLEAYPEEGERAEALLKQLRASIDGCTNLSQANMADLFLKIARVRKGLLQVSSAVEQDVANVNTTQGSLQLQTECTRTVYCFVNLVLRCLQIPSSAVPSEGKPSNKPSRKADLLLTYAKTIEAVVSIDQLSITKGAILAEEARLALLRVLEISELALNQSAASTMPTNTRAFFEGIPIRISQAFWNRYLWLTEHRRPTHDCIEALQFSIDSVQGRSLSERQAAMINLKYEKLATLLEEKKSYLMASEVLRKGIELCIELGMLNDAVEALLLRQSNGIWQNSKSSCFSLGNYLASYARCRLKCCDPSTQFAFDQELLPAIHRFVLAERQIVSILTNSSSCQITKEQLKGIVQHAWKLLSQPEYRTCQLQFTSHMLFLLERSQRWTPSDFFTYEAIRCLIGTNDEIAGACNSQSAAVSRHTLSIQWTLVTGSLTEDLATSLVANLKSFFSLEVGAKAVWNSDLIGRILPSQLLALGDFVGVLGDDKTQLDVLMMLRMLQQQSLVSDRCQQITTLIHMAVLHNRLDNTNDAGKAFAQAEKLLADVDAESLTKSLWALGYAEYLLNIANIAKTREVLHKAQLAQRTLEHGAESKSKVERDVALCRAAYLASRTEFHEGQLAKAVCYAKQAVRLSTALWTSIERRLQDQKVKSHDDSSLQITTEDLSNLTLSGDQISGQHLKGARYWSIIALHRQTLRHIASLFSHLGLYQDSLYYLQQLAKVSEATAGRSLSSSNTIELALLHASAGDKDQARLLLSEPPIVASLNGTHIRDLLNMGEVYVLLGEHREAQMHLDRLRNLEFPWLRSRNANLASPVLHRNVTPIKKPGKSGTVKRGKQTTKEAIAVPPVVHSETAMPILTVSQSEELARAIALDNALRQIHQPAKGNSDVILKLPASAASSLGPLATVSNALALLREAVNSFAADPASNALAETALGMPVRYRLTRKSGQMSLLLEEPIMPSPRVMKDSKLLGTVQEGFPGEAVALNGPQLLKAAFEMLQAIDATRCSLLPSSIVTVIYRALSQITLMSAAVAVPLRYSTTSVILQSLISKEVARTRERHAIAAESATVTLDQLQRWPQLMDPEGDHSGDLLHSELTELLQSLPHSWSIVSIGMSHDQKELLVSKIDPGTSPFLMRVPLGRPDLEQNEPHEFTFEIAKAELVNIIRQADASSHDERGQGHTQARNSWYAEREALDGRLKALLVNIENIWLGGFRGLLASQNVDSALLSRFGRSLSQSLDKHLPSRQKASKSTTRVDLHAHVLELFTNLPFEETAEFEDSITDLLYFTIDILQFNGEPNAYDEIDFDAILVDVLDALRAYHATYSSGPNPGKIRHTILILDKELEAFPWESLPCMQGRPVSRMPSLGATKQRLDLIRAQIPTADALSIPAEQGAYILNPSSDLKSTQEIFEDLFASQLPTFESLINTPPTQEQFETFLTQYPLLLYFGHGSGAQYILKRKIRAMEKCAVTWLMGCSSAKMTEYGQFESVGMPNCYIHGGSAAVMGTLWDVTDRDLDRFAMRALGRWGLVDGPEEDEKGKGKKPRGRKQKKGDDAEKEDKWKGTRKEERRGKVALDEAVSAGREACRLRYLNGAAVVVYGVPVVLE